MAQRRFRMLGSSELPERLYERRQNLRRVSVESVIRGHP